MAKKMLIDATHAEETRVVVVDGTKVEEFDFESENKRQLAGNIYLAKVTRVEPSLQAAFVDYGGNRHGFLAFSEIHPDYYQIPVADREALMAEEQAMAEAEGADEDGDGEKPTKVRRTRQRSRDRGGDRPAERSEGGKPRDSKRAAAPQAAAAPAAADRSIPGMDVVDLPQDEDGDRHGLIEDTPHLAETGAAETAVVSETETVVETAMETAVEVPVDQPVDQPVEAPFEVQAEAPAEPAPLAPEVEDDQTPPATMAMSTGSDHVLTEDPEVAEAAADGVDEADNLPPASVGDEDDETTVTVEEPADGGIEAVAGDDTPEDIRPVQRPRPRRYKIQEVIKVRQIMLVQVVKEERGNKGAALTTYLSLAGRYCVLMPNTARGGGISRKITNVADRKKLKQIATELDVPRGAGLIIRTAGAQRTKAEIKRDYEYLQRLWEQVRELTLKSVAPAKIYEEGDLIKRTIRDLYNRDIEEVLVEGEGGYRTAKDFMKMIMPSHAKNVKHYLDPMPLFARHQVESYLSEMFNPVVKLKSGGYIVIGVTEALVAIDVNSGKSTKEGSIEETALKTNLEAAEEIARQLRLRDLAGLIVIDFIDMDERKNNAAVEKRLKEKLKTDRARIQMGRISGFGLLEMSRQRLRPGMIEATTQPCAHCHGTGLVRSDDNLALSILRELEEEGVRNRSREVLVKAPIAIANYLINEKREHVTRIEARYGMAVRIEADMHLISPDYTVEKFKTATRKVVVATPFVSLDPSAMPLIETEEDDYVEEEDEVETAEAPAAPAAAAPAVAPAAPAASDDDQPNKPKKRRRRRRRRRGGPNGEGGENGNGYGEAGDDEGDDDGDEDEAADAGVEAPAEAVAVGVAESVTEPVVETFAAEFVPSDVVTETVVTDEATDVAPEVYSAEVAEAPVWQPEPEPAGSDWAPAAAEAAQPEAVAVETAVEVEVTPESEAVAPVAEEPAPAETAPAAEWSAEPAFQPVPEAANTPAPVDEEDGPAKPKKRGWWSGGL
jgi:ribonuclease E